MKNLLIAMILGFSINSFGWSFQAASWFVTHKFEVGQCIEEQFGTYHANGKHYVEKHKILSLVDKSETYFVRTEYDDGSGRDFEMRTMKDEEDEVGYYKTYVIPCNLVQMHCRQLVNDYECD